MIKAGNFTPWQKLPDFVQKLSFIQEAALISVILGKGQALSKIGYDFSNNVVKIEVTKKCASKFLFFIEKKQKDFDDF